MAVNSTASKITAEELRLLVSYDPETGVFTRRVARTNSNPVGAPVDCREADGRLRFYLAGRKYFGDRLAWLYMTGEWPPHDVDHEDRNPANDRWVNLRLATRKQNCENSLEQVNNTSGYRGVHWCARQQKWISRIGHNGRRVALGVYETREDAAEMRDLVERMIYSHTPLKTQEPRHG